MDESSGDYKGTAAQKPLSDCSDKKRTLKFVCVVQARIVNDPSKSIKSIARNIRISEFLIKQVVHEDIQYFSYKMKKSKFLS